VPISRGRDDVLVRAFFTSVVALGALGTFVCGGLALMRTDSMVRSDAYPWMPPRIWSNRLLAISMGLVVVGGVGLVFAP
jgi:hypothetical protein